MMKLSKSCKFKPVECHIWQLYGGHLEIGLFCGHWYSKEGSTHKNGRL